MEDVEADARAINAEPWDPPPGMVKRQCPHCRYFFAAPSSEPEAVLLCPDCAAAGTRTVLHHDGGTRTLVHLVGIGDSVGAAPANRVGFTTAAPKTWPRRKSAICVNRAAMRSILST